MSVTAENLRQAALLAGKELEPGATRELALLGLGALAPLSEELDRQGAPRIRAIGAGLAAGQPLEALEVSIAGDPDLAELRRINQAELAEFDDEADTRAILDAIAEVGAQAFLAALPYLLSAAAGAL